MLLDFDVDNKGLQIAQEMDFENKIEENMSCSLWGWKTYFCPQQKYKKCSLKYSIDSITSCVYFPI